MASSRTQLPGRSLLTPLSPAMDARTTGAAKPDLPSLGDHAGVMWDAIAICNSI